MWVPGVPGKVCGHLTSHNDRGGKRRTVVAWALDNTYMVGNLLWYESLRNTDLQARERCVALVPWCVFLALTTFPVRRGQEGLE